MIPDRQRLFFQCVAAIFEARQEVADLFCQDRVTECVFDILESNIKWRLADSGSAGTARLEHVQALRQADALFEEISYLKKGDPIAFAAARERILFYIREVMRGERKKLPAARSVSPLEFPSFK